MKVHVPVPASFPPSKRRWKGFASAVLALVFFSLLVPLAFLLGAHSRFPSGYLTDERASQDSSFGGSGGEENPSNNPGIIVDGLIRKLGRTLPKDAENIFNTPVISKDASALSNLSPTDAMQYNAQKGNLSSDSKDSFSWQGVAPKSVPSSLANNSKVSKAAEMASGGETKKPCELEFGSYCLWSIEHKEAMRDSIVKKLKDQLFVARAYYPTIVKLQSEENFSREMKQNIQEHERMLSESIVDADLPSFAGEKIAKMKATIAKAKSFKVDCGNVDKKLRQILDLTEDEAHFHRRQSAFLYHLGVETMPKSLHCFSMRLTLEYFRNPEMHMETKHAEKFESSASYHYVIFSKNILAASVTINSTVMNSKENKNMVFHLLTDGQNYFSMRFWFSRNSYREASIRVLNIEDFVTRSRKLGIPPFLLSEEFRISFHADHPSRMRTEYTSVFGHSHFLLPDILKNMKKVVVLDDDVVVQQDLTPLWSLNLQGKVVGAVQLCDVRMGQLKNYLGTSGYDEHSCIWMSGLNIVDLETWRERGVSITYGKLLQEVKSRNETSFRALALPISFLAFRNLTFPLEDSWVLSGLGSNYGISMDKIEKSAVLHYNGNMKPWLELGIPNYKPYWRKFLIRGNRYMDECNAYP